MENLGAQVDWQKVDGLLPVIVQDYQSSEVLMLGYMNEEALRQSLEQKRVIFYSRTKKRLWLKGEESGNFLDIINLGLDCDKDTLLILAKPAGPTCHSGSISCFDEISSQADFVFLARLERLIAQRKEVRSDHSYTAKLFESGLKRIAQKVGEEGVETALAVFGDEAELINESADLLFHLSVLLASKNLNLNDVIAKLKERNKKA